MFQLSIFQTLTFSDLQILKFLVVDKINKSVIVSISGYTVGRLERLKVNSDNLNITWHGCMILRASSVLSSPFSKFSTICLMTASSTKVTNLGRQRRSASSIRPTQLVEVTFRETLNLKFKKYIFKFFLDISCVKIHSIV